MAIRRKGKSAGLLVGRFQPFHNGHLEMVNQCASKVDLLYIGIGSSNIIDKKNPFSAEERKMMISNSLSKELRSKVKIFFVPDFQDDNKWMGYVDSSIPKYDFAFSSDDYMSAFYKKFGKNVIDDIKHLNREVLSGTNLRSMIVKGGNYQAHLPKGTLNVIALREMPEMLRANQR